MKVIGTIRVGASLDVGRCAKHPKYKVKRAPIADCARCRDMWRERIGSRSAPDQKRHRAENWRPIIQFDGYDVSDRGRVRSWKKRGWGVGVRSTPLIRTPTSDSEGYLSVVLRRDGKSHLKKVHVLVLEAFVGPRPSGQQTRHYDGCPWNNQLSNLLWGTSKEQAADRARHGTLASGERNGGAKLTNKQARSIRSRLSQGAQGTELAALFGVSIATVSRIKNGVRYAVTK